MEGEAQLPGIFSQLLSCRSEGFLNKDLRKCWGVWSQLCNLPSLAADSLCTSCWASVSTSITWDQCPYTVRAGF